MARPAKKDTKTLVLTWLLPIALWELSPFLLPAPHAVLAEAWERRRELATATLNTGLAALTGYALAVGLGVLLSLLMAASRLVRVALYPWVVALQLIPIIVLTPLLFLWMGRGLPAIAVITLLISLFPIVANTVTGLAGTDKAMLDLFRTYNATKVQEIFLLRLPCALPHFLAGLRIAAVLAPIGAITADFLMASTSGLPGLGVRLLFYRSGNETPAVFAVVLLAGLLGFVFAAAVHLLSWALLHRWHDSAIRRE